MRGFFACLLFATCAWGSESLVVQGKKAYRESRLEEAERCWKEALARDPYEAEAEKGLQRIQAERLSLPASEPYAQAVKDLYEAGMKAYRKEYWGEAEEALARASALLSNRQINRRLTEVREKIGKHMREETSVMAETRPMPEASPPQVTLAPSAPARPRKVRKPKPVEIVVDQIQVKELYAAGVKAYRNKRIQEALECWRKVVALDPTHERALKNIRALESQMEPGTSGKRLVQ